MSSYLICKCADEVRCRTRQVLERLTAEIRETRRELVTTQNTALTQLNEIERLTAELEVKTHQHKRDLAEYNRVADRIAKLERRVAVWKECSDDHEARAAKLEEALEHWEREEASYE